MTEEKELICRVQKGDVGAFEPLVQTYEKQVYNLCLRMVGNAEDARDLAQEAFLKAWRGLGQYQYEAAFSTWLYRLTGNVCIDFLRQQKRRPAVSLTLEQETTEELQLPDPEPTPEQKLLERESRQIVAEAMEQLETEFRQILTLRVVQNLPYEQIAQVMDLKVGTVKSRLARARAKLRKILLQNGNYFGAVSSNYEKGEDAM